MECHSRLRYEINYVQACTGVEYWSEKSDCGAIGAHTIFGRLPPGARPASVTKSKLESSLQTLIFSFHLLAIFLHPSSFMLFELWSSLCTVNPGVTLVPVEVLLTIMISALDIYI